jgi:hypothetical protein
MSADRRWQSREQILKAHLESLSPDELLRVRPDYWAQRFGPAGARHRYLRKYDPDQPRVPAGNPDGGQWTSNADVMDTLVAPEIPSSTIMPAPYLLAANRPNAAYCWNQMQIDMLYCSSLSPKSIVAACRGQAMERFSA